jgi:hypothetical protein
MILLDLAMSLYNTTTVTYHGKYQHRKYSSYTRKKKQGTTPHGTYQEQHKGSIFGGSPNIYHFAAT